jgi:hypothetical protein
MLKIVTNIIFYMAITFAMISCAQQKPQSYTIACDANGNPVLVTES